MGLHLQGRPRGDDHARCHWGPSSDAVVTVFAVSQFLAVSLKMFCPKLGKYKMGNSCKTLGFWG